MQRNHFAILIIIALLFSSLVSVSSTSSTRAQDLLRLPQVSSVMKNRQTEDSAPLVFNSEMGPGSVVVQQESALVKLRNTIFPIYGKEEVKKFLLLGSIKFFIILALTLTRDTKDTLVVTQCGAEAIAFLKVLA